MKSGLALTSLPKVVIAIVGEADTGKSRLLREFAQKLNWADTTKVQYGKKCGDWLTKDKNDIRVGGDYNGHRVAIMSGGDDADTIIRAFIYVSIWKCDILIIATHPAKSTQGLSISWVALDAIVAAYDIKLETIGKTGATDADRERTTQKLKDMLERIMSSLQPSDSSSPL